MNTAVIVYNTSSSYGNLALYYTYQRLQSVKNVAARLITQTSQACQYEHITLILRE